MADSADIKKIRRAGVKLIPKFPVNQSAANDYSDSDDTITADSAPRKGKLIIKKVTAAPTKFAPKNGKAAKPIIPIEEDIPSIPQEASVVTPKLRTQKEIEDARKSALEAKLLVGNKNDTMKVYMGEIAQIPLVNKKEEADLAEAIHSTDPDRHEDARTTLIKANLRLVVKIAHDFKGLGLPLLDLISEGEMYIKRLYLPVIKSQYIRSYICAQNGDFAHFRDKNAYRNFAPINIDPFNSPKYNFKPLITPTVDNDDI